MICSGSCWVRSWSRVWATVSPSWMAMKVRRRCSSMGSSSWCWTSAVMRPSMCLPHHHACRRIAGKLAPARCSVAALLGAVPGHAVLVAHPAAAEDVERAAEGEVEAPAAQAVDQQQVVDVLAAAGIGAGQRRPAPERLHQLLIDAAAQALDVGGMDEQLAAMGGERGEVGRAD